MIVHGDDDRLHPTEVLVARWLETLHNAGIPAESTVLRRVFCRDVISQRPSLDAFASAYPGSFSAIGQPPLNGAEMAIWSYHIIDPGNPPAGVGGGAEYLLNRGPLRHAWNTGLSETVAGSAEAQSFAVMEKLDSWLAENHLTLSEDVVRTWWFVRDIDRDYPALVEARKAVFEKHGLTKDSHFIASTGIAGGHHNPAARLSLDTYAIGGLRTGQLEFISAPDHLGPTHRYGVTFERATSISYSDRKHIFLSGTASINPEGEIVHPGDVVLQLARALENSTALLAAAGADLHDLLSMIIYLRNPDDAAAIEDQLRHRFDGIPMVIVHGPVCRPGWLVEVEGIACVPAHRPEFPDF